MTSANVSRAEWYGRKNKIILRLFLTDVVITMWFIISGNDHFCIRIFIFTEENYHDVCWGLYKNKHVMLDLEKKKKDRSGPGVSIMNEVQQ